MAFEEGIELHSVEAGADLSAASNLFKVVKLDANGKAVAVTGVNDVPYGIQQDVAPANKALPIAVGGVCKAKAGATIAAGAVVATKADGTLQTAVTGQTIVGVARFGAVNNDVFSVMLTLPGSIKA